MRRVVILFCLVLIIYACVHKAVNAQVSATNIVSGNTYNCFFYSYFDVFDSEITFSEGSLLSISKFKGQGLYVPIISRSFSGMYLAVNETIGEYTGDIVMNIYGTTFDPFIVGTGVLVMEYSLLSPIVFHGLRIDYEEQ